MPWCHAWRPGCTSLAPVVGLAGHRYHMVILPLSLGCVPPAVLVEKPDLLKIRPCAIGLTHLFTSFYDKGSHEGRSLQFVWLLPQLCWAFWEKHLKQAGICLGHKHGVGLGA